MARIALVAAFLAFGCGAREAGAPPPSTREVVSLVPSASTPTTPPMASASASLSAFERLDAGRRDAAAMDAGARVAPLSESVACGIPSIACHDDAECIKVARPGCSARCIRRPWMPVAGHPEAKRPAGQCRGTASPPCLETVFSVDTAGHRHYRPECLE